MFLPFNSFALVLVLFALIVSPLRAQTPGKQLSALSSSNVSGNASRNARKAVPDVVRFERRVLELTNIERRKAGLSPLCFNPELATAARWLAQEMSEKNYFAHIDQKGRSIEPRLPDFGYTGYETIGENIAGGQMTPEAVMESWLHSEKHRHNLFNPDYTELGVGFVFAKGSELKSYWVQDFGRRFDHFPLVINDESGETTSCEARLYFYGEGWAEQVRLSKDGMTWSDWQPFSATRRWMLDDGEGTRTVYVELKHGAKIFTCRNSIELKKPKPEKTAKSEKEATPMSRRKP